MKSKDELCNELIKFSKHHLAFEFEDVYGTEENCYKNYDYILSNKPTNVAMEVGIAVNDILLYGNIENKEEKERLNFFIDLAYDLNIYCNHFREKKHEKEQDI